MLQFVVVALCTLPAVTTWKVGPCLLRTVHRPLPIGFVQHEHRAWCPHCVARRCYFAMPLRLPLWGEWYVLDTYTICVLHSSHPVLLLWLLLLLLRHVLAWQGCVPSLKALVIPLRVYLLQTLLFFCMSVLNNVAFNFRISQPVHVVVRSANLILTYVVGRFAGERCVPWLPASLKMPHVSSALRGVFAWVR